jgi:hypothetical protein
MVKKPIFDESGNHIGEAMVEEIIFEPITNARNSNFEGSITHE